MRLFTDDALDNREDFPPRQLRLAAILPEWDPIGVFEPAVQSPDPTEYDDLVAPISVVLRRTNSREDLEAELDEVMTKDYGLPDLDLREVAAALIAAWKQAD